MFDKSSTLGLCAVLALVPACSGRLKVANDGHGGAGGTDGDASGLPRTIDSGAGGDRSTNLRIDAGTGGGFPVGAGGNAAGGSTAIATGGATIGAGGATAIGVGGATASGTGGAPMMWMGNVSACPAAAPPTDSACPSEGTVCGYWTSTPGSGGDNYTGCRCVAANETSLGWDCTSNQFSALGCPHDAQPANGSSCFGFKGLLCPFPPRIACACDPNAPDPKWLCLDPNPVLPGPTAKLDGSKPVSESSDADRKAFCEWFATGYEGPGFPPPPDVPPSPDGLSGNTGCAYSYGAACRGKYPTPLPVSSCMANLALSTCKAPLSDLVDCATTLFNSCLPSPRGCGPYLSSPGCSGTIITSNDGGGGPIGTGGVPGLPSFGGSPDCAIRVR